MFGLRKHQLNALHQREKASVYASLMLKKLSHLIIAVFDLTHSTVARVELFADRASKKSK